jgi:hypothetical protein
LFGDIGDDAFLVDPGEDYLDDLVSDIDEEPVFTDPNDDSNYAPQIDAVPVQQIDAGSPLSVQLDATDSNSGQSLTFSGPAFRRKPVVERTVHVDAGPFCR